MSLDWEVIYRRSCNGGHALVTTALLSATEDERRAFFKDVEAGIKAIDQADWWRAQRNPAPCLALAVIGTSPNPSKAAALLLRRNLRDMWRWVSIDRFLAIAAARELDWLADLGTRLAQRLPTRDVFDSGDWRFTAAILRAGGAPPPVTEGVVRGWLAQLLRPREGHQEPPLTTRMRDDEHLDLLLPAVFEINGMGADIINATWGDNSTQPHAASDHNSRQPHATIRFHDAVAALVAGGRLERKAILAATIDRLARGDKPHALRPFVLLHEELSPTVDEIAGFTLDYTRLLAEGPGPVAALAQSALRVLDDNGLLDVGTLLETSVPVLLRKEKTLVKAQMIWLDRVARRDPGQAGEVFETIAVAFGHPALDIQERALTLIARHLPTLSPGTITRIAEAAPMLAGDLPARAAELFGTTAPEDDTPPSPLPAVEPAPMPPPILTAAELAEEVTALIHDQSGVRWERVLAALVALHATDDRKAPPAAADQAAPPAAAHDSTPPAVGHWKGPHAAGDQAAPNSTGDQKAPPATGSRGALAAALCPVLEREAAWFAESTWNPGTAFIALGTAIRMVIGPPRHDGDYQRLHSAVRTAWQEGRRGGVNSRLSTSPDGVLTLRAAEIAVHISGSMTPELAATPTHVNGSIDPAVLLQRLARAEAEGWQPWPFDLEQALLRLPRTPVAPEVATGAAALTSPAGRQFAQWLASAGLPDPVSEPFVQLSDANARGPYSWDAPVPRRMAVTLRPARDGGLRLERQLLTHDPKKHPVDAPHHFNGRESVLAMVLPHHREVAAAWALGDLACLADQDQRGAGRLLPLLAECAGPVGPAMAYGLAYTFGAKFEPDRAAAVDAFLLLAADTEPFAAKTGAALGELSADSTVKLSRVIPALADAHRAGASVAVWELLTAALPPLLTTRLRAVPDLLEFATRVAIAIGARTEITGLAEAATLPGTSRLARESRRLRTTLTA